MSWPKGFRTELFLQELDKRRELCGVKVVYFDGAIMSILRKNIPNNLDQPRAQAMGTVFGDAPCLVALIDRFAQHWNVLDIDGDSWRDKERIEKSGRKPRR